MVSRYGVAKEGAVGVAVGVGPMHCLLPHCGGPHHHLSPHHPQNQNHNHVHTHNHQQQPNQQPLSPHGPHIGQMNHGQHQLTINIGHHHQQQQQQQQQGQHQQPPPPQFRIVAANPRSDFHVPGQNYGAQPGAQVGGGGGSIGVPGGRGPSLGGIPQIGQSTPGIQPGGPAGGQQQQQQQQTPGVQQQQQQGPAQTTTPPVHTPPQDMGKQAHLQTQPPSLQQSFVSNQTRPVAHTQGFYQMGPRPNQARGLHSRNQGGGQLVPIPNVATSAGQPTAMYQNIAVPGTQTMYVPGQVPNIQQTPVYPMNNHMQPIVAYQQQQRHQAHQTQPFFTGYPPHTIIQSNVYAGPYQHGPPGWNYYQTHTPPNSSINLSRASANAVTGGGQNVGGPLAGAQGTAGVPQGTLQQQTPQPQTIPPMAISLTQQAYVGHNGGAPNTMNSYHKVTIRSKAIIDIVDPETGKNVANEIYRNAAAPEEPKPRETPQPQNSAIIAEFASRVAKAASEGSESSNTPSTSAQEHHNTTTTVTTTTTTTNLINSKIQLPTNKEQINTQCNNAPAPSVQSNIQIQSQVTDHQLIAQQIDTSKIDAKSVQSAPKDSWQRNDTKQLNTSTSPITDDTQTSSVTNKDNIPIQKIPQVPQVVAATESDTKSSTTSPTTAIIPTPVDITAPQPARESFPTAKTTSNSPPRRKSQLPQQQAPAPVSSSALAPATQPATVAVAAAVVAATTPSSEPVKEQKERKLSERSVGSRGATPTPTQNQNEQKYLQKNGETAADKSDDNKAEQKSPDGKGTQKQKSKNKLKSRDLNRKGADKEGTDMDAFVNAAQQPVKTDVKTQQEINETTLPTKPTTNAADATKEISAKEQDGSEIKPDLDQEKINQHDQDKHVKSETINDNTEMQSDKILQNHKETSKETTPTIEDSNKSSTNSQEKRTNDVVDHANVKDVTDVEAIVAQKNEENNKVSGLSRAPSETKSTTPTIDKQNENEPPNQNDAKALPELKYQYDPDQWSPRNADGKKRYGRDLLMKLQEDPKSRVRPPNLLDLEVVLKDSIRQPVRNAVDFSVFKGKNAHEMLFPGFAKSSFNAKLPPPTNKKSYQSNKKPPKPNVIHVSLSLREDIKLRETENAWKPGRMKSEIMPEDDAKSQALYKKVRSVLNKLTPQKFATLVNQVRSLEIDTQERLQGVIDLVFEKAVDEPSFSVAYALMCKELSSMKVSTGETKIDESGKEVDINVDFRKLLLTRCQMEFEKNMIDESARAIKLAEIDNASDPNKKKELTLLLEDDDRKLRMKSVGNIRFIGELYKQDVLITKIMHTCIKHLLETPDEENLECLCKLFTTIGKILEGRSDPKVFPEYFNQLAELAGKKSNKKINSRVRFMIQDVIDLRANSWIPRRDESNPKTMDQIQKEAESERLEIQMNNTPMNTPRKDDRNRDRGKNRGGGGGVEDGWTVAPLGKTSRQPYSIEASKLTAKSAPLDEIKLGSRNAYLFGGSAAATGKPNALGTINKFALLENMMPDQDKQRPMPQLSGSRSTGAREYRSEQYKAWEGRGSRNGSHMNSSLSSSREGPLMEASRSQSVSMPPPTMKYKPPTPTVVPTPPVSNKPVKTTEQLKKIIRTVLDMANGSIPTEIFITDATQALKDNFDNSTYPLFITETLNAVLEKSFSIRQKFSALYAHMINNNMIPLSLFQSGYEKVLEFADDLVIDIPKCWTYFAEILSEMVTQGAHPLAELKKTSAVLRSTNNCGKLVGELLSKLAKDIGPKVVAEKWDQSGLQWSDLVDTTRENPDDIVNKYKLEFLMSDYNSTEKSSGAELTYDQIQTQLVKLIRDSDFDNITRWISANVGERPKEPQFVRTLVNAILDASMEHIATPKPACKLNSNLFKSSLVLITRYVDTAPQLEVECLLAIQVYLHSLGYPQGILGIIIDALCEGSIISDDAFFAWQACDDPANPGHAIAMTALYSFFIRLREHEESSEEA